MLRSLAMIVALTVALLALASAHSSDAATLAGRVIGWDDEPIAGAEIVIAPGPTPAERWPVEMAPRVLARAVTDASGAFAIDDRGVEPGNHVVLVRPVGRPQHAIEGLRWAFGWLALPTDVVIRIPSPATLHGIVLDEAGAPVRGALVLVRASASDVSAVAQARSGGDGRFAIEGMPRLSRVRLRARTEGLAAGWSESWIAEGATSSVSVTVEPPRVISGAVVHHGAPIANARLVFVGGETWSGAQDELRRGDRFRWLFAESRAGADGSFRLTVPHGMFVVIAEPGWPLRVVTHGSNELMPASPRDVRIVGADGEPLSGAEVGWEAAPSLTSSDAAGMARLPDIAECRLLVRVGDFTRSVLPAIEGVSVIELPRERPVRGVVTSRGARVEGATVRIGEAPAVVTTTNASGRYATVTTSQRIGSLVLATSNGWSGSTSWTAGDTTAHVGLGPGRDMTLEALGLPKGSLIVAETESYAVPRVIGHATEADAVTLPGLIPGPWSIIACGPDGSIWNGEIPADPAGLVRPLRRRWPLRLRCVDPAGRPIEGAMLSSETPLAARPQEERWFVATSADGTAIVAPEPSRSRGDVILTSNVDAREIGVWAVRAGYVSRATDFVPEKLATFWIVMEPEHPVTGHVVADARPVAGARVMAEGVGAAGFRTADDGRFTLHGLGKGKATIVTVADGWLPDTRTVQVGDAPGPELEIPLERGRTLTGRVVRADATPVAGIDVIMETDDYDPHGAGSWDRTTDETGEVRADGAPMGRSWVLGLSESMHLTEEVESRDDTALLTLPPLGHVRGFVTSHGVDVSEAEVACSTDDDNFWMTSAIDGSFMSPREGVTPGTWECTAKAITARGRVSGLRVTSDMTATARVVMRSWPLHTTRDRSPQREPVPGTRRWFSIGSVESPQGSSFVVDARGRARVPWSDDFNATGAPPPREVLLRGDVLGADGGPAPDTDIEVRVDGTRISDTEIALDGSFAWVVSPGRLHVVGRRLHDGIVERGEIDAVVTEGGARGLEIRLARVPSGILDVTVTGGASHADVFVEAALASPMELTPIQRARESTSLYHDTDEHGFVRFEGVPPGRCVVKAKGVSAVVDIQPYVVNVVTIELP